MKIVISEKAYADLQKIYLFYAEHDQTAAEKLSTEINRQFVNLARFPQLGRYWPETNLVTRRLVIGRHLIFYRTDEEAILILRVLDGRMDVEAELLR